MSHVIKDIETGKKLNIKHTDRCRLNTTSCRLFNSTCYCSPGKGNTVAWALPSAKKLWNNSWKCPVCCAHVWLWSRSEAVFAVRGCRWKSPRRKRSSVRCCQLSRRKICIVMWINVIVAVTTIKRYYQTNAQFANLSNPCRQIAIMEKHPMSIWLE